MGNKNILSSKEDILSYYIEKKSYDKVEEILKKNPELIQKTLTKESKHTPLMRAAFLGD